MSGRKNPPPTIKNAGEIAPGIFYDLAPSMVPIPQRAKIPPNELLSVGSRHNLVARDKDDVERVLEIFGKRRVGVAIQNAKAIRRQLPAVKPSNRTFPQNFPGSIHLYANDDRPQQTPRRRQCLGDGLCL